MERETGIEPATSSLGSWRSTAELLPPKTTDDRRIPPGRKLLQDHALVIFRSPAFPIVPPPMYQNMGFVSGPCLEHARRPVVAALKRCTVCTPGLARNKKQEFGADCWLRPAEVGPGGWKELSSNRRVSLGNSKPRLGSICVRKAQGMDRIRRRLGKLDAVLQPFPSGLTTYMWDCTGALPFPKQ